MQRYLKKHRNLTRCILAVMSLMMGLAIHCDMIHAAGEKEEETFAFGDYVYFGNYGITSIVLMNEDIEEQLRGKESGFYDIDGYRYYIDSGGNPRNCVPMRWMVIADEGDTLLLLQDYVVRSAAWDSDSDGSSIRWSNSDIRSYINSDSYMNLFFTEEEKKDIQNSVVYNTASGDTKSPVSETLDKLYLPSKAEIEEWFPDDESKRAHYFSFSTPNITTPISGFGNANAYNTTDYTCAYWTRTPHNLNYGMLRPAMVSSEGVVGSFGRVYNTWSMGLRPLMRISKDSTNYYRAPENVRLEFESKNEDGILVTTQNNKYRVPVKITGDNMVEQFKPYVMALCYPSGKSYSTSDRAEDSTFEKSVFPGIYTVQCILYGIEPNSTEVSMELHVEFAVETIKVKTNKENNALQISWTTENPGKYYEVCRSTEKDGEYEVLCQTSVSTNENSSLYYDGETCHYTDYDVEVGQEYWYKVKGLIYNNGYTDTVSEEIKAEYSEPVSGEIISEQESETEEPEKDETEESESEEPEKDETEESKPEEPETGESETGNDEEDYPNGSVIQNGLALSEDGNWYKYVDGEVDDYYTGLYYDVNYGWWLVVNGQVAFDYTGLWYDQDYGWWLIGGGAVCFDYTGLWNDPIYGWWLIGGGTVCFDYTGLWNDPNCGWWLIGGGTVCFDYTGLWNDPNCGWWLIGGGTVCFDYTGLWNDPVYGWWLIGGGAVCFDYYGLWNDPNCGWWYIEDGTIPFHFTGFFCDANYTWWYIENGAVALEYTGKVYLGDSVYNVVNGMVV